MLNLTVFVRQVCQLYVKKLQAGAVMTASGYFTVNNSLVTSFLGTTFTYWVILIQFTQQS